MFRCRNDLRRKLRRDEPDDVRFSRGEHVMPIGVLYGGSGDAGGELRRQRGMPCGADGQLRAQHLFGDGVRGRLLCKSAVLRGHLL